MRKNTAMIVCSTSVRQLMITMQGIAMLREAHDDEMHFRFSISKDLGQSLSGWAHESTCDVAEVLSKALFLYSIALKANQAGNQMAIVSKSDQVLQRIVGVQQ